MIFLVPPNIIDRGATDEIFAKESSNVSLSCKATGQPEPSITWKKEDGSEFMYQGQTGICETWFSANLSTSQIEMLLAIFPCKF